MINSNQIHLLILVELGGLLYFNFNSFKIIAAVFKIYIVNPSKVPSRNPSSYPTEFDTGINSETPTSLTSEPTSC